VITGGSSEVIVSGSTFEDHSAGGIVLAHGHLVLKDSILQRNLAVNGGAMRVSGGHAEVSDCRFEQNEATESGGALHVDGGEVELSNRTVLLQNRAPTGKAVEFTNGSLSYTLPVPLGRWLLVTTGTTLALEPSAQNSDYPFACSPGLIGDSSLTDEQNGPWCSRACDPGYYCPSATSVPQPCLEGTYCEQGSSAPTACEDGTWSNATLLTRQKDCMECPAGKACSAGAAVDCPAGTITNETSQSECTPCAPGSYQSDSGQTACVECTAGFYCVEGAVVPTPCPAGSFSGTLGLKDDSGCSVCTLGHWCGDGSSEPTPCVEGKYGDQTGLLAADNCIACDAAQHRTSIAGSSTCMICEAGYYKLPTNGTDVRCKPCPADDFECQLDTDLADIVLKRGRWRLSETAESVTKCEVVERTVENWVGPDDIWAATPGRELWHGPCKGGDTVGIDGEGYCEAGHTGPRCELCISHNDTKRYFNYVEGYCMDCPVVPDRVGLIFLVLALVLLLFGACTGVYHRPPRRLLPLSFLMRRVMFKIKSLALMPKAKLVIAFYQCVQVFPAVYGITLPDVYYEWMSVIDFLQFDWAGLVVPGACIGDAHTSLLLLKSLVPLAVMLILLVGGWLYDLVRLKWRGEPVLHPFRGLLKTLPLVLFVSFSFCPTVSTSIFQAWSCDEFVDDSEKGTSRQYLRDGLSVRCTDAFYKDETHSRLTFTATFLVSLWPVAFPLIYIKLLLSCRKDIITNHTTALVSATSFLHREYSTPYFWWETIFLIQRLVLVGFIQMIPERSVTRSFGFMRILGGLTISMVYCMLLCALKPFKRRDLDLLSICSQFALVCVFLGATLLRLFQDIEMGPGREWAVGVLGFESEDEIVAVMLVFNLSALLIAAVGIVIQSFFDHDLPTLRLMETREVPDLAVAQGLKWHTFVSHIWSSGQDQSALIKRQLALLMPTIRVFLDVDNLEDISQLERYINETQCVIIFLSKGCKGSAVESMTLPHMRPSTLT
jgi:predicted outer membrane repeat protein